MIQPVSPAMQARALDYLARAPFENVFLSHVVLHDRSPDTRRNVVVAREGDAIHGVAYFGRQITLAAEPEALEPFGAIRQRRRGERMIVGPRETVRRLLGDRSCLARAAAARSRPPAGDDG